MKPEPETRFLRYELDEKLKRWRRIPPATPEKGWINTIREALDMSERQLADRLNMTQSGVSNLQCSEASETISIAALKRAATALDCSLQYALIPKHGTLQHTIKKRRRKLTSIKLMHALPPNLMRGMVTAGLLDALGKRIKRRDLWEDPPLPPAFQKVETMLNKTHKSNASH